MVLEVLSVELFYSRLLLGLSIDKICLVVVIWWDVQANRRDLLVLVLLLKADLLKVSVLVGNVSNRVPKAFCIHWWRFLLGSLDTGHCFLG